MGFGGRMDSNSSNGRATYRQDVYSALGTNSEFDVEIGTVDELEKHLVELGFSEIQSVVTPSWSDVNHRQWIWTTAKK
jgi:adenylate cyclase class IV